MKRKPYAPHKGGDIALKSARASDKHKPRMDDQDENLTCTICYAIFTDPVALKCSHSFCQECLQLYWKDLDVSLCPICRKVCSSEEPTLSLAFKSLCESVKNRRNRAVQPDQLCPLHGEKFKLFCSEDKLPLCVICHTSKKHKNHTCSPIEEAVQDLKVKFFFSCHSSPKIILWKEYMIPLCVSFASTLTFSWEFNVSYLQVLLNAYEIFIFIFAALFICDLFCDLSAEGNGGWSFHF